ncbi:MAG: hypothetical protein ACLUYS_02360 [Allobaculum sp.]|uniref:hypothetical protein n=1 Tax=Allobaculum sp. TaxID=1872463 RepID=UPI003999F7AF
MKEYVLFPTQHCSERSIDDLAAGILYLYLFEGLGVKGIEDELLGKQEFRGYLAKTVLNYFGVDTSPGNENKKMYYGMNVYDVASTLLRSEEKSRSIVGQYLLRYLEAYPQSSR